MTFRTRLTLMASLAVAAALIGASLVVYYTYRHDLLAQADSQLKASLTADPVSAILQSEPVGNSSSYPIVLPGLPITLVVHVGRTHHGAALNIPDARSNIPVSSNLRFSTKTVNGVQTRRLTVLASNPPLAMTRSLADVDRSLSRLRWLLGLTCLGGIGVAALLGTFVSGRVISPLRRLTEATERIAETGQLGERTGQRGRDEISRLSVQLDALLATLEQSLRTQRQLVADASHELRTPLATLRANVGLLARSENRNATERAELVADVEDELESMTTLVSELVELAHGEELDVEPTEFRLDELVRSAVDRAAKRTRAVRFRVDLEPATVVGVPERIERAINNLLDNARKWSPEGETIDVSVHRDGVVEVRDRGPGIAAEDAPLVFNRFYRSANARSTPGAGLGLAIVKQVADAHHGKVSVDQAPGGGAIVRLML